MPDAGMSRALLRRYWGWATLFRSAATGLKPTFGIDLAVLAAQFGGGERHLNWANAAATLVRGHTWWAH
eukprot:3615183-Pleurochrysis_carterae.AAC.2